MIRTDGKRTIAHAPPLKLPTLEVNAAAHVVEALFGCQHARSGLAGARNALGPVKSVHELWERLDGLVSSVDAVLAELQVLGQVGLELHGSHTGAGCTMCHPRGRR